MAIDKQMHGIVTCLNTLLDESDSRQRVIRYENFISESSSDADDALTSIEEWAETLLRENGYSHDYTNVVELIGKQSRYSVVWYAMNCLIRIHDVRNSIRHGDAASAAAISLELMGAVWQANERTLKEEVARRHQRREQKLRDSEQRNGTVDDTQEDRVSTRLTAHDDASREREGNHHAVDADTGSTEVIDEKHAGESEAASSDGLPVNTKESGTRQENVSARLNLYAPQKDVIGLASTTIREKVQSLFQIVKPAQSTEHEPPDVDIDFSETLMEVMEADIFRNTEDTRKYYQQVINQVKAEYPKYDLDAVRQLAANRLDVSKQYLIKMDMRPN